MAGLSLLAPVSLFSEGEEPPPARRAVAATTPTPQPTPQPTSTPFPVVHPQELKAAEARLDAAIAETLRKASDHAELMSKELSFIKEKIQALAKDAGEDRIQLDKQGKDARAFAVTLDESGKRLDDGLKKVDAVRAQIESKGQRMEGLLDLVNTLKRDLNDNSHEIAELKHDFESVKKVSRTPTEEQDWWDQLSGWKYMPLAAAVLGGVALGVAASHK
jgi:hypothetical protein